jgi:hypothetical protein
MEVLAVPFACLLVLAESLFSTTPNHVCLYYNYCDSSFTAKYRRLQQRAGTEWKQEIKAREWRNLITLTQTNAVDLCSSALALCMG